jgi:glucose/arabinose dehydrogenase
MKQFIILIIGSIVFMSCSRDNEDENIDPPVSNNPVETNAPNADYRPAFEGQTRASGVTSSTAYKADIITSSLTRPWGITSLPDGRLLITQKTGSMRIVNTSGNVSAPITGIPVVNSSGQGGLLGLCLDPEFATNRMVYWSFSEQRPQGTVTAIAKGRLADNETQIEGATVIYRAEPAHSGSAHYGGRVIFDRTGYLLASTGERSDMVTRAQSQAVNSALGKIIRINKDGQPAPDNPFLAQSEARPELFSIGHRNPQGLAMHPVTGDIWQSEHGPRGGDELNRVVPGANYGWPIITYGIEYNGQRVAAGIQQQEGLEQPVYYWDPVISPSGITFYKGNRIPEWENNLFIGALSGTHIVRLVIENNTVIGEERLLTSENQRFRDITQGADNALYAITDEGTLYKIDRQ